MSLEIHLTLLSDATFGRGDGVAGLVDEEIEYDAVTGLPFLRGRTLKGLLVEECANILFALKRQTVTGFGQFEAAAQFLFGRSGSTLEDDGLMHVGSALLPKELREAVKVDVEARRLTPTDVLESLTAIRRQTAVDEETAAPDESSLRAMRVIVRDTTFIAETDFDREPNKGEELAKPLLAACVMALRRAGIGRNRGRGRLQAQLFEKGHDKTANYFKQFEAHVKAAAAKGASA